MSLAPRDCAMNEAAHCVRGGERPSRNTSSGRPDLASAAADGASRWKGPGATPSDTPLAVAALGRVVVR